MPNEKTARIRPRLIESKSQAQPAGIDPMADAQGPVSRAVTGGRTVHRQKRKESGELKTASCTDTLNLAEYFDYLGSRGPKAGLRVPGKAKLLGLRAPHFL